MIGILGYLPWVALGPIILLNGLPEAGVSAVLVLAVVTIWQGIARDEKQGADI
jgi:hypothetical protein